MSLGDDDVGRCNINILVVQSASHQRRFGYHP